MPSRGPVARRATGSGMLTPTETMSEKLLRCDTPPAKSSSGAGWMP